MWSKTEFSFTILKALKTNFIKRLNTFLRIKTNTVFLLEQDFLIKKSISLLVDHHLWKKKLLKQSDSNLRVVSNKYHLSKWYVQI